MEMSLRLRFGPQVNWLFSILNFKADVRQLKMQTTTCDTADKHYLTTTKQNQFDVRVTVAFYTHLHKIGGWRKCSFCHLIDSQYSKVELLYSHSQHMTPKMVTL